MNIVHVINSISTGGAENVLLNSIAGFKKYWPQSKHYLIVLYAKNEDARLHGFEKILHLNTSLKRLLFTVPQAKIFLRKNNIQVIHSHLWDSLIYGRLIRNSSMKLIHTYHSADYRSGALHHSRWRIWLDKMTYAKSTMIYVSQSVKTAVQSQIPKQNRFGYVVPNFCTEDFRPAWKKSTTNTVKLIAVGTLREAKNYPLMIAATSKISNRSIHLDIYGEGALRSQFEELVEKLRAPVGLKGNQPITSELFSTYQAFIMTSKIEGMPVALVEAITSGMPSILPAYLEVMEEIAGESAYYFNSEQELVTILENIDLNELERKSNIAVKKSKNYSLIKYILKLKELYE